MATGSGLPVRAADLPAAKAARSGVDPGGFNKTVRPQDDLFRYVNGGWIERVQIPADRGLYGSFVQLLDKSETDLRDIIEEAAKSDAPPGSETRKIGDLYSSFMNEDRVETLGLKAISVDLRRIDAAGGKAEVFRLVAQLQHEGVGGLFGLMVSTDDKQSDRYITSLVQGGISLPDESYYREAKFQPIREKYLAHIEKMLTLAGLSAPKETAARVLAVETELASHHWDRVKRRDRTLSYNSLPL